MAGLISSLSFHVNGFLYYLSKTDIHPAEGIRIITQLDVCLSFVTKVCFSSALCILLGKGKYDNLLAYGCSTETSP